MITKGRAAAIAIVALGVGFLGGAWFFGSGLAFRFIPAPVENVDTTVKLRTTVVAAEVPKVKAVAVPELASSYGGSSGLGPAAERLDLLAAPGCFWVVEPRPFRLGASWQKYDAERHLAGESAIAPVGGGVQYLLVQSSRKNASVLGLRPVLFDAEANRYLPKPTSRNSLNGPSGGFLVAQFQFDSSSQLAADRVAFFGIEVVVPDADRLLAEAAQKEAKEKGIEIPPRPIIGQPYTFDLRAAGGDRLRAIDYRGKAVLVFIWGPGGFNRLAMNPIRKVRASTKPDELAIIGISFDGSVEDARKAFANTGADGPIVVVSNDTVTRRLWRDGTLLPAIPAIYLLDSKGILCSVSNLANIETHVDILLGRPKRPLFPPPKARAGNPAPKSPAAPPADPAKGTAPQGPRRGA